MTQRLSLLILTLLLALAVAPTYATTVVLGTDEDLFDQANLIAEGTVLSVRPAASGAPATEYRVRVERTLKGRAPIGDLTLRVPGGTSADGWTLTVWGAPELQEGERTLLFLGQRGDGAYSPLHLGMGAFHEVRETGGRKIALRDLSEMDDAGSGSSIPAVDRARDFDRFSHWIADRAAGLHRPADYFLDRSAGGPRPFVEKFNYLQGRKQRWIEFDAGQSIGWRVEATGQPALPSGGFPEFQAALKVWNDDPNTNILYTYLGTTTNNTGFQDFDDLNTIIFGDPHNEATGTFTCSAPGRGSGVLAVGGTWTAGGPEPIQIGGADIVVNDGADCWFVTGKRAEQVYGHELGHTLGLGHSCGDARTIECIEASKPAQNALMRASAFPDDRGATLSDDDRAGILTLYPNSGNPSGGKPAKPTNLKGVAESGTSIKLSWKDNARNETAYRVEVKPPGGAFQIIGSVPAGTTQVTVTELLPGKSYTFRVQALSGSRVSPYSNQAKVKTRAR